MLDAAADRDWEHTSFLLAQMHNVQCISAKHLKSPDDYNPRKIKPRKPRKFNIQSLLMCVPAYRDAQVAAAAAASKDAAKSSLIGGGSTPADPSQFVKQK